MKTLVAMLLALAFVCLALPASAEKVDDPSPFFKQAAEKEQRSLDNLERHVIARLNELVQDGAVRTEKMEKLRLAVKLYREDAAEAKAVYGNLVVVNLNPKIDQVVDWYHAPLIRNGARHQTEIQKNLAELTGVNIQDVQENFSFGNFLILSMVMCVLGLLIPVFEKSGYRRTSSVCCGVFLFTLVFLILALFGF